jgi:hypothetical protein
MIAHDVPYQPYIRDAGKKQLRAAARDWRKLSVIYIEQIINILKVSGIVLQHIPILVLRKLHKSNKILILDPLHRL